MGNIESGQYTNNFCEKCNTKIINYINSERVYVSFDEPLTALTVINLGKTYYIKDHYICKNSHKFNCIHL